MTDKDIYGTDSGPQCTCGGTIYAYHPEADEDRGGRYVVESSCLGCGMRGRFGYIPADGAVAAAGISRVHRNHVHHESDIRAKVTP